MKPISHIAKSKVKVSFTLWWAFFILLLPGYVMGQVQDTVSVADLIQKTDSLINLKRLSKADSLEMEMTLKLDSISTKMNSAIDSLSTLNLPQKEYLRRVDSVFSATQLKLNQSLNTKEDSLNVKANAVLKKYEQKLMAKRSGLDTLARKFDITLPDYNPDMAVELDDLKIPGITTPEFDRPDLNNIPSLPNVDIPGVEMPSIDNVTQKLDEVKALAGEYQQKIESLKETDVKEELEKLPGELENQVKQIDQVKDLNGEFSKLDKLEQEAEQMKGMVENADAVKEEVKKRTRQAVTNQLEGKDEAIKKGIEQLEKYQKKYHSVADIRYLPKRRTNTYADKKFIERIAPGVMFQVGALDKEWKSIDVSPYAEYWFNDRFRAGLGGSYRINLNTRNFRFEGRDRVYAFRAMANYKILSGLFAHVQVEAMRTKDGLMKGKPSVDPELRIWDNSLYVGLFKTYRISKSFDGNVQMLYDALNIGSIFNTSQLAFRFGVEYKFGQTKKRASKSEIL
mgnify:CR=1 FL=1